MKTLKLTDHFKNARETDSFLSKDAHWTGGSYFAIPRKKVVNDEIEETLYTCEKDGTVEMPDDMADKYIAINWLEEVI